MITLHACERGKMNGLSSSSTKDITRSQEVGTLASGQYYKYVVNGGKGDSSLHLIAPTNQTQLCTITVHAQARDQYRVIKKFNHHRVGRLGYGPDTPLYENKNYVKILSPDTFQVLSVY